jgi:acetyl esterase/lipase
MRKWISLFAIITIFASCSKTDVNLTSETVTALDMKDVPYATVSPFEKMDVYLPAGRSAAATNCLIVIHGGGWNAGDKADMNASISAMKPLLPNYATFNINYRLANSSSTVHPAQMDDIDAAIDFITSKATDYKVNANKIVLIGASAGAHLALLKAYKQNSNGKVKAVVDLFGPTDLFWMYYNHPFLALTQSTLINFLGVSASDNPSAYRNASPINFVTANVPPTLILHGQDDFIVPIRESDSLKAALQNNGVAHQYVIYPNAGHGDWSSATWTDAYGRIASFVKTYVP